MIYQLNLAINSFCFISASNNIVMDEERDKRSLDQLGRNVQLWAEASLLAHAGFYLKLVALKRSSNFLISGLFTNFMRYGHSYDQINQGMFLLQHTTIWERHLMFSILHFWFF